MKTRYRISTLNHIAAMFASTSPRIRALRGLFVVFAFGTATAVVDAQALNINFATDGIPSFQTGPAVAVWDNVYLQGVTGNLSLELGIPVQATINSMYFGVAFGPTWGIWVDFSLNRSMTISSPTSSYTAMLDQSGSDWTGFVFGSALVRGSSSPIVFDLPEGTVSVTLLGGGTASYRGGEGGWNELAATFELTSVPAVPEPSTYAALFGFAALAFAAYRRRQRHSA